MSAASRSVSLASQPYCRMSPLDIVPLAPSTWITDNRENRDTDTACVSFAGTGDTCRLSRGDAGLALTTKSAKTLSGVARRPSANSAVCVRVQAFPSTARQRPNARSKSPHGSPTTTWRYERLIST